MSVWTHVNGSLLIDDVLSVGMFPGDCASDDRVFPMGSEGPLKHSVVERAATEWARIAVWGDLRDYDDVDEIIAYFTDITDTVPGRARSGIVEIEVTGRRRVILRFCTEHDIQKWVVVKDTMLLRREAGDNACATSCWGCECTANLPALVVAPDESRGG